MSSISYLFLSLVLWSTPKVICGVRVDPNQPVPIIKYTSLEKTWANLSDIDLLARVILSEQSSRVLNKKYQVDSIGIAWATVNRTRGIDVRFNYGRNNLYKVVTSTSQYSGMEQFGNGSRAGDPDKYWRWYGDSPDSGRLAYWTAYVISACVLRNQLPDPTHGALFFASAYYAPNGLDTIAYPDGYTRFRKHFGDKSYKIKDYSVRWNDLTPRITPNLK